jgi:hypothetical protein
MGRFDLSGVGLDEEPALDEYKFEKLLREARVQARDTFMYSGKPDLNSVSSVLDGLEAMSDAEWDKLFFLLELSFETPNQAQNAAIGAMLVKAVVGRVENDLEVTAHNIACDWYNDNELEES